MSSERDLYSKIYANAQDSVFLVSPGDERIIFHNPKALEDTAYEAHELSGREFHALFLPEERDAIRTLLRATMEWNSGIDPQRVLRRKSGKKIVVEITSLVVDFEGNKAISCSVRDITDRVKAEVKVQQYSKELERLNSELEDRVAQRTSELAAANEKLLKINEIIQRQKKELDDVMNNIQEAILTVNPQLKINPEYSKFAAELFGGKVIAGADLIDFLAAPQEKEAVSARIREWLDTAFHKPESWELIKDFGLREFRYLRPGPAGGECRDLKLEWRPIFEKQAIAKIMLVCLDVTEQKRLQAEIEEKEEEHREELELISQLINLPLEVVEQFVSDFERNLGEARVFLAECLESGHGGGLSGLIRCLHTIKGSARQFRLGSIENRSHLIESKIKQLEEESPDEEALQPALEEIEREFSRLEKSLRDIVAVYEKIIHGQRAGLDEGAVSHGRSASAGSVSVPSRKIEALLEHVFPGAGSVPAAIVRRGLSWLLEVPLQGLFDRLEQLARSLAGELGKELRVIRQGNHVRIDGRVSPLLYDCLSHVIRNGLDHAAESADERAAKGKKTPFTLTLHARRGPDREVVIEIMDDGKGIDPRLVARKAIEKGLISADQSARTSREELLELVFQPGFSTRDEVTHLSGRGVGLDIVKETIENKLHGAVKIKSKLGTGTIIRIQLPAGPGAAPRSHCLIFSRSRRLELEKALGSELRSIRPEDRLPEAGGIVADLDGYRLLKERDAVGGGASSRIVCVDSAASPKEIMEVVHALGLRHYVSEGSRDSGFFVRSTLSKLNGTRSLWGLEAYLAPGSQIQRISLRSNAETTDAMTRAFQHAKSLKGFAALPEIVGTIANEMIMNGMFDAPQSLQGKPKYNHLSRSQPLVLEPSETVVFRYGSDPRFFGMSVEDCFGALSLDTVLSCVRKGYRRGSDQMASKSGGAGLGLFMIFDYGHYLVINSSPGARTEVISLISLSRTHKEYEQSGKSISFFVE